MSALRSILVSAGAGILLLAGVRGAAPQTAVEAEGASSSVVREILDPASGTRWLLVRNPDHPAGPGRLIVASKASSVADAAPGTLVVHRPVIRSGESLVVEQNTPVVEARFSAVALESALAGARLRVRLTATGATVRAVALAPGRAVLDDLPGGAR